MRILHISTAMSWRGGENQVILLITEQIKKGLSPKLICHAGSKIESAAIAVNCPVITYNSRGPFGISLASLIGRTAFQTDIVHVHDSHGHTSAILAAAFFNCKAPVVLHRRVDFPVTASVLSRWKYNHQSIKAIICVSDAVKNILAPSIKNKDLLITIHDAIDTARDISSTVDLKVELHIPPECDLIGNVAALADHKDYPTFIAAAKLIKARHSRSHFIIAGDGPLKDEITRRINENKTQDYIHLLGFRNDISAVLNALDVFMFTSKEEGLGSVILEAFRAGVPVVCTNAGGITEVVKNEYNGLVSDVGNPQALCDHVLNVLNDRALKNKLISNGKVTVQHFSATVMTDKINEVYNRVFSNY